MVVGFVSCQAPPRERPESIDKDRFHLVCRTDPVGGAEVEWIDAPMEADQKDLDRWCATVGPPLAITREASVAPVLDSLCVITWNVEIGGGDLVDFVADIRSGILSAGRPITDFVMLLQETYRSGDDVPAEVARGGKAPRYKYYEPPSGRRRDIAEIADLLGLNIFYVPSMRNGDVQEDRGNTILSTMPLKDLTAIELPFEVHRRVATAATVDGHTTDGRAWSLRVASMHLDHRSRLIRIFNSAGVGRMRQARALVDAVPETPAVVAGDMNTWAITYVESTVEFVHEAFGKPAEFPKKDTIQAKWMPDRQVDFMFFRLDGDCTGWYDRVDHRYGSDHWPLIGWVHLTCNAE